MNKLEGKRQQVVARRSESLQRMLTVFEVAELLHVHPNTIRLWSNNGMLNAYRLGSRRDRRFKLEDVNRFLKGNGQSRA